MPNGFFRGKNNTISVFPEDDNSEWRPLQHISMLERLRLLCGKRRILEGEFIGYGIKTTSTLVNTVESENELYIPTSFEWNVKDAIYNLSLRELKFETLPNETISLFVEGESGRKKRYQGSGGVSSTGSSSSTSNPPLVLSDLPGIYGTEKVYIEKLIEVADLIESSHEPEEIDLRMLTKPSWATVLIDDETKEIVVKGVPDITGEDQILIEATDDSGDDYTLSIPVLIFPTTSSTYTLSPGGKITPGLPKQIPHDPPYDATIRVEGGHDRYSWEVKRGSVTVAASGLQEVSYTDDATYTALAAENLTEGIYTLSIVTWRDQGDDDGSVWVEVHRSSAVVIIGENIGEGDPDHNIVATLTPAGAVLTGAGTTVEYIPEFNILLEPVGVIHDELFVSIMPEEDLFFATLIPSLTATGTPGPNEELNPADGTGTPDAGWSTVEQSGVSEGECFWSDGAMFLYDSLDAFVSHHPAGEVIIPSGVDKIVANKANPAPSLDLVTFTDYTLFPALEPKPPGSYSGFIRAYLEGTEVYTKYVKWVILEEEPIEPTTEAGLILVQPGSVFTTIAELPLSGGVYPLPTGWNVLCPDFGGQEFDRVEWTVEQDLGGWTELDIPRYTGRESSREYPAGTITANAAAFWNKASTDIGSIHTAPSRFRATFTAWMEGVKVGVKQSDFMFRPNVPLGDDSGLSVGWRMPLSESIAEQDANIPESGGYYQINALRADLGEKWVAYPFHPGAVSGLGGLDGATLFNETRVKVEGVLVATVFNDGNTLRDGIDAPYSDFLDWGTPDGGGNRVVGGENIDLPGAYTVEYEFFNASVSVGVLEAVINWYDEDPGVKDPSDCCKDGGEAEPTRVNFPTPITEWVWNHGWGRVPILRIIIGGEEWQSKVVHSDGDNTTTIFFNSPRAGFIEAI